MEILLGSGEWLMVSILVDRTEYLLMTGGGRIIGFPTSFMFQTPNYLCAFLFFFFLA